MAYTSVFLNFLNTEATSYLQFFQTFSIHLSLLGPTPKNLKCQKLCLSSKLTARPILLIIGQFHYRIFENIMFDRMRDSVEKHSLLYSSQYGFRQANSTQHAILDMVETIQINMGKKLFSSGVFYWLKKSLDTVNHNILLDKLNYYGFRGIVNQWLYSYLSNRTQTTEIGSHISSKLNINCGVPQGSVLGPLLFLLYTKYIIY